MKSGADHLFLSPTHILHESRTEINNKAVVELSNSINAFCDIMNVLSMREVMSVIGYFKLWRLLEKRGYQRKDIVQLYGLNKEMIQYERHMEFERSC